MRATHLDTPSAGAPQSADPGMTVDPTSGDLILSWIEGDGHGWGLYVARSAKFGEWSAAVLVAGGSAQPHEVHPHGESSPRLVSGPSNRLAVVWPSSIRVDGRKWPATMLRFSRSDDGGRHWSTPVTLNDDSTGALVSHQFHGATLVGDSGLAVAWLDEREAAAPGAVNDEGGQTAEPDAHIYFTTTSDFGRTWGANRKAWNAACPCCRVSLARAAGGGAVAGWRQHFPGNVRDVVTATLSEQPGPPRRVHADDWVYEGCPHSGPAIAPGEGASTHVAWYNGKQGAAGVYYAKVGDRGAVPAVGLVKGEALGVAHPAVASLPDGGALAAYDVSPDGKRVIRVARVLPSGRVASQQNVPRSEEGKYPQLVVLDSATAVVGWTESIDEGSKMRLALVSLE